jgi:hypothetical protein
MTRIVLNPTQLSQTGSELDAAAGEYQAIGAQVFGCDCGCMPADVAAVVDSVTADVRSALQGLSSELGAQASDISQRAGVSQEDGFSAVSGASGGASMANGQEFVVGGGFDTSVFGGGTGDGQDIIVGGGFDTSVFGDGTGGVVTIPIGGFDPSVFGGGSGGGQDFIVGGNFDIPLGGTGGGGQDVIVGSSFDTSVFGGGTGGGQDFIVGGNFDIPLGGTGGGGQDFIVGGNFNIPLSPSNVTDGYLALAAFVGERYQHISEELAAMGPVYSNDANPFVTSSLIRSAWDAQRRLDVVMSPTYHDSSYFENRSDYLDQYPVDIRPDY